MKFRALSIVLVCCILFTSLCACAADSITTEAAAASTEASAKTSDSAIGALADNTEYYGTVFGQGEVTDINVEISEADWQDILDNAEDEEYHSANITVNGTTAENVGFRTKGFSSLSSVANSDSDRFGFKIKLDEYVDGQTLDGLDTFVLNGSFSDPSYMREYLTYAASAYLDCDTPYISYCNLYINGELFGFYLCIESYDDSFVERYTDSEDTVLYKAVSENCTLLTSDDGSGFDIDYGEDDDYTNIKNLVSVLNSTTEDNKDELEAILDVDSVLKAIAVNAVMGNYDSYSGSKAHNYYLLFSGGKFTYLGWDYNMSIGGFSEDKGGSVDVELSSPVYGTELSQRPLIEKLLAIDEYYEQYISYVESLTNYFSDFEATVSGIADEIYSYVENDPSAFYTIDEFKENITESDADLTQVSDGNNGGMGGGKGGFPSRDGTQQDGTGAERPEFADGYSQDRTPPSGMPVQGDGQTSQGTQSGQTAPYGDFGNNGGAQHQMGGGSINSSAVSIVDYITQRLENIQSQINA